MHWRNGSGATVPAPMRRVSSSSIPNVETASLPIKSSRIGGYDTGMNPKTCRKLNGRLSSNIAPNTNQGAVIAQYGHYRVNVRYPNIAGRLASRQRELPEVILPQRH